MQIAEMMMEKQMYFFDEKPKSAFAEYVELRQKQAQFANARSVRNALDRIRLRPANRQVS